jgi:short-subunit dehydrogenase
VKKAMSGRVVIVTGASSGIGDITARAFGRRGDRVALVARRADRLEALAAEIPDSLPVPADLSRGDEIARVVDAVEARLGAVDVLVNNAGLGRYDWLERLPEDDIQSQMQINLIAPILLTRAVLPGMLRRGRGVIINICSVAGKVGTPTTSIYNAGKFGLDGFSQAMRREVLGRGVEVCVVYPGPTAGTEFGTHARRVSLRVASPAWLRTDSERVARVVVGLADRPRARTVLPWPYRAVIAVNELWPSLVDRLVARAAERAREAGPPGVAH